MKLFRPIVAAIAACLLSTGLAVLVAPTAQASSFCSPNVVDVDQQAYFITFLYTSGKFEACAYSSPTEWVTATRDAVVRGEHQLAYGGSNYANVGPQDNAHNTGYNVWFYGAGPTGYVTTDTAAQGPGPTGWQSSTKTQCYGSFIQATGEKTEQAQLRDFVYHVGEVAKTNSKGYSGGSVVAARVQGPGVSSVVYSPTSCPL